MTVALFAVMMAGLAGITSLSGRRVRSLSGRDLRARAIQAEVSRLMAINSAALPSSSGCSNQGATGFSYRLCVRVSLVNSKLTSFRVVVTPDNTAIPADSSQIWRSSIPSSPIGP